MMAPQDTAEDMTVVIPTLGRPLLEGCLQALADGDVRPAQVVVVHQGTDARTSRLCADFTQRGLPCRYVARPEDRGVSAGRNQGVAHTDTRFFSIIDDDCIADRRWLGRTVDNLRREPETVFTGRVLPGGEGDVPSTMEDPTPRTYLEPLLGRDVLFASGMGCAVAVYARVGPFDERPVMRVSAEDNEWAYRALRNGFPIRYDPQMAITHLDWRSPEEMLTLERRYARGQGVFYGLYLRKGDRFILRRLLHDVKRSGKSALRGLVDRDAARTRLGALRVGNLLRGTLMGLRG